MLQIFESERKEEIMFRGDMKGLQMDECVCLLPISVGCSYHEGEKLRAVLSKIGQSFRGVILVVACSLQRIRIAIDKKDDNPEKFHDEAVKAGDEWLARNKKVIQSTIGTKLQEIIRWDKFLKDKNYAEKKQEVEKLHDEKDGGFHHIVETAVSQYVKRRMKRALFDPNSLIAILSRQYVLEECGVLFLWKSLKAHFIVYPGKINPAIYHLLSFIHNESPNFLLPLKVEFSSERKDEKRLQKVDEQRRTRFFQQNTVHISKQQLSALLNDMIAIANKRLPVDALPKFISYVLGGGMSAFVEAIHVTEGETYTKHSPACCSSSFSIPQKSSSSSSSSSSSFSSYSSSSFSSTHFPPIDQSLTQQPPPRSQSQPSFS